jgi:2-oxoglutarate ferredoxin oxidoreductase subunit alpha
MMSRWGTHGDHWVVVVSPSSVPESFELTIRAVGLSEKYRVPVIMLMDEVIGHMREKIVLPDDYSGIETPSRKLPSCAPEDYLAYAATKGDPVPAMAPFGSGYRWHVTGLVHDDTGFPKGTPAGTVESLNRLHDKIYDNLDDIVTFENYKMDDAEFAVISFGGAARSAYAAVNLARQAGLKVGLFRPITVWPFPEKQVKKLAGKMKGILVHELNYGQYVLEVERVVAGKCPVSLYGKYDNESATPEELFAEIKKAMGK